MQFTFFPSFFKEPTKLFFADQEPDEKIILFLRQHAIVNVGWIALSLLLTALPAILLELDLLLGFNLSRSIPTKILIEGLIIWYLVLIAYVFQKFLHWYFNIYIVTDMHLVDITFTSFLSKQITEIELGDIESVTSKVNGFLQTFLNFGDLLVETAGRAEGIEFTKVPKPDFVSETISDLRTKVPKQQE